MAQRLPLPRSIPLRESGEAPARARAYVTKARGNTPTRVSDAMTSEVLGSHETGQQSRHGSKGRSPSSANLSNDVQSSDRVFHVKLIRTLTVTRRDEERSWVAMRMMLTLDCVPIYCLEMSAARRIGDSVGL